MASEGGSEPPNGEQETTVPLPGGGGQRESHLPPSSPAVSVDESLRTTGSIDCLPYDGDDSSVENWNSGFKDRVAAASRPGGGASGGGDADGRADGGSTEGLREGDHESESESEEEADDGGGEIGGEGAEEQRGQEGGLREAP